MEKVNPLKMVFKKIEKIIQRNKNHFPRSRKQTAKAKGPITLYRKLGKWSDHRDPIINKITNKFISCCVTLDSAKELLAYPPNPSADKIFEILVSGKVIPMYYCKNDRKQNENEVLVPLKCIISYKLIE